MQLGNTILPTGAAFAPMAGFTSAAVRAAGARHGAIYTVSEMVSAKALCMGDKKTRQYLKRAEEETFYGIQLFGSSPEDFKLAAEIAAAEMPDFLDINMGCPAPKIVKTGAGSALMHTPALCGQLVAAAKMGSGLPVTVKIRKGIDGCETAVDVAKACEAAGAAAVVVHARTREEMYTPGIDITVIAAVKAALNIPVVGNGDITCAENALAMLAATGCDSVMVGRAALGNPWLFNEINAALNNTPVPARPALATRMEEMLCQMQALCLEKGEGVAMREARPLAVHFLRGLNGAAALRSAAVNLHTLEDARNLARRAIAGNPGL